MPVTFTSTYPGASPSYVKYVHGPIVKHDRRKDSTLLDFSLAPIDSGFVKLPRGAYIKINSAKYANWYTGYVVNDPEWVYLGSNGTQPVWGYRYQCTSEDYLLNLKTFGIIQPFLNRTMGDILKSLVDAVCPGVFDVSNIQAGLSLAQYAVDPSARFLDVVHDFCEAASYVFYANDKKLYFIPQDTVAGGVVIDGSDTHFTPSRLTVRPTTTPVVNDVVVLGDIEPQNYVHEYFIGTGFDGSYDLVSSVFGADTSVLLDEAFSGGSINGQVWDVFDTPPGWLKVSDGYLNCLGGNSGGTYNVYLRSKSMIPLEGRLRLTHGEFDFPQAGVGVIGGLWTTTPSRRPNGTFAGCAYGLFLDGLTLRSVVNEVVDTSKSVTINTSKRYVIRTIVEYSRMNRAPQSYTYIDASGNRQVVSSPMKADACLFETLVTEVDPSTGDVTNQWTLRNTGAVGTSVAGCFYMPVVSDSLHVALTGITLSVPVAATLETATKVPVVNAGFDEWDGDKAAGWTTTPTVYKESLYADTGASMKLQGDAGGTASATQEVAAIFEPNTKYTITCRVQRTSATTSGSLNVRLVGTGVVETGLFVNYNQVTSSNYLTFTGTLTNGLATIPDNLQLVVSVSGVPQAAGAFWIDELVILSPWKQQLVGPNEIDALDGIAPMATVVTSNQGAETRNSLLGSLQFNPGQSQLVFFKNSATRETTVPPKNQIIRLSYRSAGPAFGRSRDRNSINSEAAGWGDNGVRSVIRTDLTPRPRSSEECEMAAAAVVGESSYRHIEGQYTQFSTVFVNEPRAGAILDLVNIPSLGITAQAEEIDSVVTTCESLRNDIFSHEISFGKPDSVRSFLNKISKNAPNFQSPTGSAPIPPIEFNAIGFSFADDVTKPYLVTYDSRYIYFNTGQALGSDGQCFEVRYTDDGWGCDDGKNLILRTTSQDIAIPRGPRARMFFIRKVKKSNYVMWSEDQTKSNYSGASVTKGIKVNPDGNLSEICTATLSAGVPFSAALSGVPNSTAVASVNIKGPVGSNVTLGLSGSTKTVPLTGQWQRISVSKPAGVSPTAFTVTTSANAVVDITRFSVEVGTSVETGYAKTNATTYGPTSRFSTVCHVAFPVEVVDTSIDFGDPPGNVLLGTPKVQIYGENVVISIPYEAPTPFNDFNRTYLYLQIGNDAEPNKVIVNDSGGWVISDTPSDASKFVTPTEPLSKGFLRYDPGDMMLTVTHPRPKSEQMWRVYAVSGNDVYTNPLVTAEKPNPTPSVLVLVDPFDGYKPLGEEYGPLAASWTLMSGGGSGPDYHQTETGDWLWSFKAAWTNKTTDPRFERLTTYKVVIEDIDGSRTLHTERGVGDLQVESDQWLVGPQTVSKRIYLVSCSEGNTNTIVPGLTPSIVVVIQPPRGSAGVEYCSNIANLRGGGPGGSPVEYGLSTDGIESWRINLLWDNPQDDVAFGGMHVYLKYNASGSVSDVGWRSPMEASFISGDWWPVPKEAESFDIVCPGVSRSNQQNSVVVGVTPAILAVVVEPQTTGSLDLSRADSEKLGAGLAIASGLLKVSNVSLGEMASNVKPIALFATDPPLPDPLYPPGMMGYNTVFQRLKRVSPAGNQWQSAVNGTSDIVSNTITAGSCAFGFVNTTLLAAGAVTSDKLNSFEIQVGGGGFKPGRFTVYNNVGSAIGFIGVDGSESGAWFKTLSIGGFDYASGRVKADSTGEVTITNARVLINTANGNVTISPAIFDSTYSSVGVYVDRPSDNSRCWLVSRGIVAYNGFQQVCAMVRSPGNPGAGELAIYNNGSLTIFLEGISGVVRANGIMVSNVMAINSLNQFVGNGVSCPNYGVLAAGFNVFSGGSYHFGVTTSFPTGDGRTVLVKGGVITAVF